MAARAGRRTRVLHVVQNLNYGGMERLLAGIVRGLDPTRFEPHVLALQYLGHFARGLDATAELHLAEPMTRWSLLWPASLIRLMRRIAPDVVHTHSGVWYKASLAARRAGARRLVHTEHGRPLVAAWHDRLVEKLAARRTDVVVAVSAGVADQIGKDRIGDPARTLVVVNGVDTQSLRPTPDTGRLRAELGLRTGTPILGSVGRLEWVKGYDVMIEAFALLRARSGEGAVPALVIAGDGAERARLQRRIGELGLDAHVHLLGWRDDLTDLLSAFSLFTLSSRSEGTSVSLLEAMSSGCCPVVTDVGGNAAVLGPGLRHRLVAPLDPAALADAWHAALTDPVTAQRDAAAARDRVCRHFSLARMVDAYSRLYLGEPLDDVVDPLPASPSPAAAAM